jgi:hypothetical protein
MSYSRATVRMHPPYTPISHIIHGAEGDVPPTFTRCHGVAPSTRKGYPSPAPAGDGYPFRDYMVLPCGTAMLGLAYTEEHLPSVSSMLTPFHIFGRDTHPGYPHTPGRANTIRVRFWLDDSRAGDDLPSQRDPEGYSTCDQSGSPVCIPPTHPYPTSSTEPKATFLPHSRAAMVLRHPPEKDTRRPRQRVTGILSETIWFCSAEPQCSAWQSSSNKYQP